MLTQRQTIDTLIKLGHEPNKSFGQNFLVDKNIVLKSIEIANLTAESNVVEIGPGLGTLTSAILATGARLTSIERDTHLLPYLNETFAKEIESGQFKIISEDATKVDYGQFNRPPRCPTLKGGASPLSSLRDSACAAEPQGGNGAQPHKNNPLPEGGARGGNIGEIGGFEIVANLPYSVCTPLLERFLLGLPKRMTLMIQRELAERWAATEGKQFSAMSIFLQSAYTSKYTDGIAHSVGRKCFFPPPAVDSVLVNYELKETPVLFSPERQKLIRSLFLNRRKQLNKAAQADGVSAAWFNELVAEGKIKPTARAEEISVELWWGLNG